MDEKNQQAKVAESGEAARGVARDVRWDLLRSVAMLAVVAVHASARIGATGDADLSTFFSTLFLVCDPVFFALSGFFAIRPLRGSLRGYYLGKFVTIVVPVALYSVLAWLVATYAQGYAEGYLAYAYYLLCGPWWFVPALVPMLAVAPFLYWMFEALDERAFRAFVALLAFFAAWGLACDVVSSASLLGWDWANDLSGLMGRFLPAGSQVFAGYSLYFCMGYAMRRLAPKVDARARRRIVAAGAAALVADALAAQLGLERSNPSYLWALATPAVFVLFSGAHVTSARVTRAVEWTSRRSYSIYLFQAAAVTVVGGLVYDKALLGDVASMGAAGHVGIWLLFLLASYALAWLAASVLDTILLAPVQKALRSLLAHK